MPQTNEFAITYPCLTPVVTPSDFYQHAASTEAALAQVNALVPPLLRREFVAAQAVNPNIAASVSTTVSWNTPPAANNPSGMFSSGSPTVFTLQSSGSFLVCLRAQNLTFPTTMTSWRAAVLLNGGEVAWGKMGGPSNNPPQFHVSGTIVGASAGQQISCTALWTGTGGPITPLYDIQICKISDL